MFFFGAIGVVRVPLAYLYAQELTPKKYQPFVGGVFHFFSPLLVLIQVVYYMFISKEWIP